VIEVTYADSLRRRAEDLITSRGCKQAEVSVGLVAGLKYLLYRTGKHRWLLRYIDPKTKRKTVRVLGDGLMAHAVVEAMKVKELISAGRSPRETRITVGEFFDEHYRLWAEAKLASASDSISRFNRYVRPAIGCAVLAELKLPDMLGLIAKLPDRLSATTRNHVAAVVKAVFRRAHELGFIEVNAASGIRLKKIHNARSRVASRFEIQAIYDAIKLERQPSLVGLFIRLLFSTAMRSGEARKVKFEDINAETACLVLQQTKNGRDRTIKLNNEALNVIAELQKLRTGEHLFPGLGGRMMGRPTSAWNRILQRARVEGLTLHDIRRSSLSLGINAGATVFEMATFAGHASMQTTYDHYLRPDDRASQRASELIQSGLPTY
jgi:integrase